MRPYTILVTLVTLAQLSLSACAPPESSFLTGTAGHFGKLLGRVILRLEHASFRHTEPNWIGACSPDLSPKYCDPVRIISITALPASLFNRSAAYDVRFAITAPTACRQLESAVRNYLDRPSEMSDLMERAPLDVQYVQSKKDVPSGILLSIFDTANGSFDPNNNRLFHWRRYAPYIRLVNVNCETKVVSVRIGQIGSENR